MNKSVLMLLAVLLTSTNVIAETGATYAEVDREMIELLALNDQQALAYLTIMLKRRDVFLAIQDQDWEQHLAFYEQTYALLKPVLTEQQLAKFIGIIDSVIEDTEEEDFLVMED